MAEIHSIVYQTKKSEDVEPFRYERTPANEVNLIGGHGIEGDRKAGKHPNRQLNILSYETVQALKAEGYKTNPGELGEQIVIKGLDVMSLERGTLLQFGESAVIRVNAPREPCSWFEKIHGLPKDNVVNRVGIMATVMESGILRVGDEVRVLETVE